MCHDAPSDVNLALRNHKFNQVSKVRKFGSFATIATLCALTEALTVVLVFALVNTGVGFAQGGDYNTVKLVSFQGIATL